MGRRESGNRGRRSGPRYRAVRWPSTSNVVARPRPFPGVRVYSTESGTCVPGAARSEAPTRVPRRRARPGSRCAALRRRRRPRPALRITAETVALIRTMARENALWGAERLRGELLKLGIKASKRTVQKYMSATRAHPLLQRHAPSPGAPPGDAGSRRAPARGQHRRAPSARRASS
jgi:hypothetical protein